MTCTGDTADFYPRPPGGGRRVDGCPCFRIGKFLSTPSGWRATRTANTRLIFRPFLSTPSGWRATLYNNYRYPLTQISIHALRVEGDICPPLLQGGSRDFYPRPPGGGRPARMSRLSPRRNLFLSTPSGWRATRNDAASGPMPAISIHALRVEGDPRLFFCRGDHELISIHALRVEGDLNQTSGCPILSRFLSTPSGWRATPDTDGDGFPD